MQRWVLGELLARVEKLYAVVLRVETRIGGEIEPWADPFVQEAVGLLDSMPGIGEHVARMLVSEIGVDMTRVPSAAPLASWAGLCPANKESAGQRKSGQTTKGGQSLRTALVEAAWAAMRAKGTFLAAKYYRLVKRMGKKKALVAVAQGRLRVVYPLLCRRVSSTDLGREYVTQHQVDQQGQRLVKKLEALGVKATLEEVGQAA